MGHDSILRNAWKLKLFKFSQMYGRITHLVVDVHAGVQQHLHHRQVSVARGQMQRRVFLGVAAEQVGVGSEQQLDNLQAAV